MASPHAGSIPPEPPVDPIAETEDDRLDEALEESFPASDPPAPYHSE